MSCKNTYPLYNKQGRLIGFSACGECPTCRLKRSAELSFYSYCASQDAYNQGLSNYFYTLTYTDYHLPVNEVGVPTVSLKDLVLFKKRFFETYNRHFKNIKPKVLITNEYGGQTNRPHLHMILYGVPDKYTSEIVYSAWQHQGEIDFGPLKSGGSYYLTKYCSTTPTRETLKILYDDSGIERPKLTHSPFFSSETLNNIINQSLDNNLCHNLNGFPQPLPSYIRRKVDPLGVMFNKYAYLHQFQVRLRNLGMSENDYNDMLYRKYLVRCRQQGIPVIDNRFEKKTFDYYQKNVPSTLADCTSALDTLNYYKSMQKKLLEDKYE